MSFVLPTGPVHLIFKKNDKILLLRRFQTGIHDGYWCLPVGKIDKGESPLQAVTREAKEEINITVKPHFATAVCVKTDNIFNPSEKYYGLQLFFATLDCIDEPVNLEPHKHDKMEWFDPNRLPTPMIDIIQQGIRQFQEGIPYGELGFNA